MGIPGPISFLEGSRGISANRSLLGGGVGMLGDVYVQGVAMSRWEVHLRSGWVPTLLHLVAVTICVIGKQAVSILLRCFLARIALMWGRQECHHISDNKHDDL